MNDHSRTVGNVLDGTQCNILLDAGVSKIFISKSFCMNNKCQHSLLKFTTKFKSAQVENCIFVSILFTIPVIIEVHGQRFKSNIVISQIHDDAGIVFQMKNLWN